VISRAPKAEGEGLAIRPWAAWDAPAVDALLANIWGHDPPSLRAFSKHGSPRDETDAFRRTLVATSDGRLVGVATAWENPLHPARWRLVAHVDPGLRRRSVGSALFGRLLAEVAPCGPRPWQSATGADDDAGRAFLAHHGFRPLMRTRLGEVNPAALGESVWAALDAANAAATAAGYHIVALPDLAAGASLRPSLASLHAEIYRQTHNWNPPAALSADDARRLFLGDDLIPESLFVALADDRPVGVASLRRGESPEDRELGWIGIGQGHHHRANTLIAALLGRCLTHAQTSSGPVRVEVDEADWHLWRMLDGLPVRWEPDWLTFARPDPAVTSIGA
jgi:GNAT superfamily N-acetyltransferase